MKDIPKTNVMRLLDRAKIAYTACAYPVNEEDAAARGLAEHMAGVLNLDAAQVFKTLVLRGDSGAYYVFCVPATREINLKTAAAAAGEKSIALIQSQELSPLTGYVRGGCSPLGMKKKFPVFIDASARTFDVISISAGARGAVVLLAPSDLITLCNAHLFEE
jgi:Cys-tRNA(Pro)/Cys-tRNA(Cys) deacylase